MKVYIDVSNLVVVNFLTGIQRVVREVVVRLLKSKKFDVVLLSYSDETKSFMVLDNESFYKYFDSNIGDKADMMTHTRIGINDIEAGSVFFDIDSVWNSRMRRSYVLPILKKNGVKIAVNVYDVIPVTHPQYCHQNTTYFFLNYLGAFLNYADIVITNAQSTLDAVNEISDKLGLERRQGVVVPLGSDFKKAKSNQSVVEKKVKRTFEKKKYALMVGTIEPRKNHIIALKAFEKKLFSKGISLVFAGRFGWNIDELKKTIETHPKLGKQLFHFDKANDATIDYLYKNALVTLMPTYNEGFGLPIIESIERGTPVLASDIPVLKEVGKDFSEYFDNTNEDELIRIIESYIDEPERYQKVKAHLSEYKVFTWDKSAKMFEDAIAGLRTESDFKVSDDIKQMVILSARDDMLLETIPFIENFMPFITEIVICCPDFTVDKLKAEYNGRLELKFLTDSMVLEGNALPKDHSCRNFYLRCLAFRNDMIDDAFIMCDDDYRPLYSITPEVFVKDGKYLAHYCYDLNDWKGTPGNPTSYDNCMFRTLKFLQENNYPQMQYSSHMPQAIDKRIFLEMLENHKGIETTGCDEWSTYFNYALNYYSDRFKAVPYVSLGWPGAPTDWNMQVIPEQLIFENYYPEAYEEGAIFDGFSTTYHDGVVSENVQKVTRYLSRQAKHDANNAVFNTYKRLYNYHYGENPVFMVDAAKENIKIYLPQYVAIDKTSCNKISFSINNPSGQEFRLEYYYTKLNGDRLTMPDGVNVSPDIREIDLPVFGLKYLGTYLLNILCTVEDKEYVANCKIIMQ